jgi:hypothetical protein
MDESENLAFCLRRDFPVVARSCDPAWTRVPALRVIDCVLSLRRNYDYFVVPRLNRFESNFPLVSSIQSLRDLIDDFGDPDKFVRETLNYSHTERAIILSQVVTRVLEYASEFTGGTELERLELWATTASPSDFKRNRIRGFALAGFQYLRMLFGANTTKPDIHIRRYVAGAIGREVLDVEALRLLEAASLRANISLRDLDTTIWESSARRVA